MKLHHCLYVVTALVLVAVAAATVVTPAAPTWNRDNIGDIKLMMGSALDSVDVDALVDELNYRTTQAEMDALTVPAADTSSNDHVILAELRKSAYYTAIARCLNWGPRNVQNWSCKDCKKVPKVTDVAVGTGKSSDLAWFIGYAADDDQIVVTARSSTTIENWIYDLDFKHVPFPGCPGCNVHSGFYKAYREVRNDHLNHIWFLSQKYPTASIRIQGHSLAAASGHHSFLDIATGRFTKIRLADGSEYWHSSQPHYNAMTDAEFAALRNGPGTIVIADNVQWSLVQKFYNFGSPRVGNAAWAHYFQSVVGPQVSIRSTHLNDPVVRVPMRDLIWDYQHASNEIYWYSDNKYKTCNDFNGGNGGGDEDKACALGNLLPVVITDHMWYNGILLACLLN